MIGGVGTLTPAVNTDIFDYASQPKERVTSCNLCGSSVFVTIAHHDRYGYPLTAVCCRACGLVFLNPRMTREAYAKFYDGPYRALVSAYHGREINAQTIQPEQAAYAQDLARFLSPHVPKPLHTLMDVGGSTGIVARHLWQEFGATWRNMGPMVLDPAGDELSEAAKVVDGAAVEVQPGFAEDYDPQGRTFELVTICQTIDHCADVLKVLTMAHKALAKGGLLFVDIVDFKAVMRRKGVEGAIKLDHPYYLTTETMEAYLSKTGFEVLAMNYAPDGVHVGYLAGPWSAAWNGLPDESALLAEVRRAQR